MTASPNDRQPATRKFFFVPVALLLLLVVAGMFRLRFDTDVLNLLPGNLSVVEGLQLFQRHFTDSRELIITVRSSDAAKTEAAAQALANQLRAQTNLVASVIWQPAWLEHPAQAAELIGYLWLNQPPAEFTQLTNRLTGTNIAATLAEAREQLATSFSPMDLARRSYDPYNLMSLPENIGGGAATAFGQGQNIFTSPDGTFRILFVKARPDISNYRACIAWMSTLKQMIQEARVESANKTSANESSLAPLGDHVTRSVRPLWGNRLVAGLGSPWAGVRGSASSTNAREENATIATKIPPDIAIGLTGGPAFAAEVSSGMEHDMFASIGITSGIIAILFWFFHRRWVPMLWLLVLLAVILICTLGLGGLIFGSINVVSLGFAGILLGLAVDYGVVHYQEAIASPHAIIPEIRRAIGPSIFWAAVTTISAFLVLNFGGLPGLAQLGSLVALGVMLSALVMLFAFLPPLFRDRIKRRMEQAAKDAQIRGEPKNVPRHEAVSLAPIGGPLNAERSSPLGKLTSGGLGKPLGRGEGASNANSLRISPSWIFTVTALLILISLAILLHSGIPKLDHSADALRPKNSQAYAALDEVKANLTQNREPLWLITTGRDEMEISRRLQAAQPILDRAVSNHLIASFTLPTPLWPRPDFQAANRRVLPALLAERATLRQSALDAGFSSNALPMMDSIFDTWQSALAQPGVFWPTNEMSQWIMEKIASHSQGQFFAAGFIYPEPGKTPTPASLAPLTAELSRQQFILSGWQILGSSLLQRVQQNLWKVLVPMVTLVLLSLWFAFRRPQEILLSIAVLSLSGLCLLTVMDLAGWSWNLLNLMALPLMLGSGVDYSIFMQLALRRHHGDTLAAHRAVGRALLLCGGTAVAGFGSLSLSTNAGVASLGEVCAIGIGCNMLISVYLLPTWWRKILAKKIAGEPAASPSSLYRPNIWRLGLWLVATLPPAITTRLCHVLANVYWQFAGHRREIVIQNFLPPLNGDRKAAERKAREMIVQFALKLADLWRYESGLPVGHLFGEWTGWDHFVRAQEQKRGILLLTPHLGNWEFGGPLLTQRGVQLQVITLAEPGSGFTELRQASRARWDIDTLVIGEDPFAFVEIIRRLEAGATVALLVDRPPATSRVQVELFGRPFDASIAAAELARASGCVLLPVYLPHTAHGYAAHILPVIPYDRAALRQREGRQKLTQEIIRAFEEPIRQHLDQWYHFVPVWPKD